MAKKSKWPSFEIEKNLWDSGNSLVCGIDEVGRGSWAGPMVAGAVIFLENTIKNKKNAKALEEVNDSKKLSQKKREYLAGKIIEIADFWSFGVVSSKKIDQIGLTRANILAMELGIKNLGIKPQYFIIDGKMRINSSVLLPNISIARGDSKSVTIAAASIMAKVYRDRLISNVGEKYPEYHLRKNKGYGTKKHENAILKHGILPIHRKSFRPINEISKILQK